VSEWRLPTFFLTILYPINLFILARILFPGDQSAETDLRSFYLGNYRKFFVLIAVLAFISVVENILIHDYPLYDSIVPLALLAFMTLGASRGIRQEWFHKVLVTALLIVMLGSIVVNWNEWTLTS
jgi:F0F1-type ATP synthase assembly protein I